MAASLRLCIGQSAGQSDPDWPLDQQLPAWEENAACQCDTGNREGWNSYLGVCTKGEQTTCYECKFQMRCAPMSTLVGDGLRAFAGDCRHSVGEECALAKDVRISYPTAITLDEEDNLYFADYGNNRVRYMDGNGYVSTIAGTGEVGFSGDGGMGWNARLRYPEGVAVRRIANPNSAGCISLNSPCHEVFISDFMNQRIRLVRMISDEWKISTIAGTGTKGETPECDTGCVPTTGALSNPRAIAISAARDIYIVDSGNKKIRRIDDSLTTMITFVGTKVQSVSFGFTGFSRKALPGHWNEANENVALDSIYTLAIDGDQNLWFADSSNNRIWMTRTAPEVVPKWNGLVGVMSDIYFLHFVPKLVDRAAQAQPVKDGLTTWLMHTSPPFITREPAPSTMETFEMGRSYWRYMRHGRGQRCSSGTECAAVRAQTAQLSQIMGMCFDVDNNAYVSDMHLSDITYLETSAFRTTGSIIFDGYAYTATNCRCFEYWTDETVEYSEEGRDFCLGNPTTEASQDYSPYHFELIRQEDEKCIQEDAFVLRNFTANDSTCKQECADEPLCVSLSIEQGSRCTLYNYTNCRGILAGDEDPSSSQYLWYRKLDTPACTVTNYCGTTDNIPVPWCYVDRREDIPGCPQGVQWGYCNEMGVGVDWQVENNKEMMGAELRLTKLVRLDYVDYTAMLHLVNEHLWKRTNSTQITGKPTLATLQRWAILTGYVHEPAFNWTCSNVAPDLTNPPSITGCAIVNKTDLLALTDIAAWLARPGADRTVTFIWEDVVSLSSASWAESHATENQINDVELSVGDCQDRCGQDLYCKGFVLHEFASTEPSGSDLNTTTTYRKCVMFSENTAYDVYNISRADLEQTFGNLSDFDSWSTTDRNEVRNSFDGPYSARSRLIGEWDMMYASDDPAAQDSNIILKADPTLALVVQDCKDVCVNTTGCHGIIVPGCWLITENAKQWLYRPDLQRTGGEKVAAYVKLNSKATIRGVAGKPNVRTFNEELNIPAEEAFLNRPGSCTVTSKGDLLFADMWNQRIRMISGLQSACHYDADDKFDGPSMTRYQTATNEAIEVCARVPSYAYLQHAVVENRSLHAYNATICYFDTSSLNDQNATNILTNTTANLMVLCGICYGARPIFSDLCPSSILCECREKLENILNTTVWQDCSAPDAYGDSWHLWASAYVQCLSGPNATDLEYMEPIGDEPRSAKNEFLRSQLMEYSAPTMMPTADIFN